MCGAPRSVGDGESWHGDDHELSSPRSSPRSSPWSSPCRAMCDRLRRAVVLPEPYASEVRLQLHTALPTAATCLLSRFPWLASLSFVGRIGPDELAAAALATTLCNVTGLSLGVGLSAAITTLAGQARGELLAKAGAKAGTELGIELGIEVAEAKVDMAEAAEAKVDMAEATADGTNDERRHLLRLLATHDAESCSGIGQDTQATTSTTTRTTWNGGHRPCYASLSMDVESEEDPEERDAHVHGESGNTARQGALENTTPPAINMPLAYLFRGMFVQLLLILPVGLWWLWGVKSSLIALGQGERVSEMTEQYLRILTPGLWSYGIGLTLTTWLQTVDLADVPPYITAACLVPYVPLNVLFIHVLGYGYLGAAIATSVYQVVQPLAMMMYLFGTSRGRDRVLKGTGARSAGRAGLTLVPEMAVAVSSVPGLVQYVALGLPGLVSISEWWASEVSVFWGGELRPHPSFGLDGMTINQTLNSFCFMLPVSISVAGAASVGRWLGSNDGRGAKIASAVCVCGAAALGATMGSILYFTPHSTFPSLLTTDVNVIREASRTIPLLSTYVFADGIQCALGSVAKGCGRQAIMIPIVLVAYWVVGLPLSYYLSFVRDGGYMCEEDDVSGSDYFCGIVGLVGGMTVGTWVHMMLLGLTVAFAFDWDEEAKKAQIRLAKEKPNTLRRRVVARLSLRDPGSCDGKGHELSR